MSWDLVSYIATDPWVESNKCADAAMSPHTLEV